MKLPSDFQLRDVVLQQIKRQGTIVGVRFHQEWDHEAIEVEYLVYWAGQRPEQGYGKRDWCYPSDLTLLDLGEKK